MGAAPGPSPIKVATEFARVYYKVVATLPARLAELYGDESQLDHGPSLRASGHQSIAHVVKNLPLTGNHATLDSLIGQSSANGNVVVAVRGHYSSPPIPFVQTFLLAKQSDSHDEHFYCCNDIFLSLQPKQINSEKSDVQPREPPAEPLTPPKLAPVPTKQSKAASQSSVSSSENPVVLPSAVSTLPAETTITEDTVEQTDNSLSSGSTPADKTSIPVSHDGSATVSTALPVDPDRNRSELSLKDESVTTVLSAVAQTNVPATSTEEMAQGKLIHSKALPFDQAPPDSSSAIATEKRESIIKPPSLKPTGIDPDSNTESVHHSGDKVSSITSPSLNEPDKSKPSYNASASSKAPQSKKISRGSLNRNLPDRKSEQDYRVASSTAVPANTRSTTPMKKTWASIVLSRDDSLNEFRGSDESIVRDSPSNGPALKPSNESTKRPLVGDFGTNDLAIKVEHEMNPPAVSATAVTSRASAVSNLEKLRNSSNNEGESQIIELGMGRGNGEGAGAAAAATNGRSTHLGRGNSRAFGPSAVVTLSSTGMGLSDVQALRTSLLEEFSRYGHSLRGVEVKAGKGIAFIEYDSMDGVRAAVDAWAHGPRSDGVFAGVPLHVSEKRTAHMGRRPGSTRGGNRGGSRGGSRRGRVTNAGT